MSATTSSRRPQVVQPVRRKRSWHVYVYPVVRAFLLTVLVVGFLGPLAWMVLASFKTNVDIYDVGKTLFFTPTLDNFETVFATGGYALYLFNSFWIGAWSTLLSLVIAVPAAYSMSRFVMRKSAGIVLLARVIPAVSLLIPWYYVFSQVGLVGGYPVLILSHMFISVPLILYIMMSFFDQLPTELEEAGQVDGLTPIGAFLRVTLPLSAPGLATASILAFIFSWNNFMFALILAGNDTKTLPVAIFDFVAYASVDWGGLMAASVTVTIPVVIIALLTQRYIVTGFTAGATKG